MHFGEVIKSSDWRYILQVATTRLCYGVGTKSEVKRCIQCSHDSYTTQNMFNFTYNLKYSVLKM